MEKQTNTSSHNGVYILPFSSITSSNTYDLFINIRTGYYQIDSIYGNTKYEGYLWCSLRDATSSELNNFAYNIIELYYKSSKSTS